MLLVISEQRHLPVRAGADKAAAIKVERPAGHAVFFACGIKPSGDQIGNRAGAAHAGAKFGLIAFAVAHLADQRHDLCLAIRIIGFEPFFEQVGDFKRQADDDVRHGCCPGIANRRDQIFDFHVIEAGNDRRAQDRDRNAGIGKFANGIEPTVRGGGTRFKKVGQSVIKACNRYRDRRTVFCGHWRDQVDVAGDKCAFGGFKRLVRST